MIDVSTARSVTIDVVSGSDVWQRQPAWADYLTMWPRGPVGADPRWLMALADGLWHIPYCLEARRDSEIIGLLPLALVSGPLFGRFLVSLPYVSTCGILGMQQAVDPLCEAAIGLADELRVHHLELRTESPLNQPALVPSGSNKVLMRRDLPPTIDELWKDLDSKVRNQIRKGEKQRFDVTWGRDLFVAMGEPLGNGSWSLRLQYKPLVRFIWLGALVIAIGGFIAVCDRRYRQRVAAEASSPAQAGTSAA